MPVKNAGQYLVECVESILVQSHSDWELIAVDDHSTDRSLAILQDYASRDNRISVIKSTGNGIISALQTGYAQSSGDAIHRMDADDIMPSRKLELLLGELAQNSVVTGKVKYFCKDKKIGDGFKKYENWLNSIWKDGNGWSGVYKECPIASPAWLMYREDFEKIGGFNSALMPEDYDLAFRIKEHELQVNFINQVVHYWRDSSERTSRIESKYFPIAYYPLKVECFLKLDIVHEKHLVLWGAGKKGKLIARLLLDRNVEFLWVTNNSNKLTVPIYGKKLQSLDQIDLKQHQHILAISGLDDKAEIANIISSSKLSKGRDYFWFC